MNLTTSTANPLWHFRRSTGSRRILHVPQSLGSGPQQGAAGTVVELVKQQLKSGMEPIIITSLAPSEPRHEIIAGVRVHRHPDGFLCFSPEAGEEQTAEKPDTNPLSIPIIQSLMQEPEVRVFHAHTVDKLGGEVLNAARVRCLPFVATVHGSFFNEPAAGTEGDSQEQKPSWSSRFASRKVLEEADMVVFVDEHEAAQAKASLGHDRIAHLPEGVDCARFAAGDGEAFRIAHCIPQDAVVIGSISRGDQPVDSTNLLEAFARVAARHPMLHLLLVGPQAQLETATSPDAIISRHHLEERVHQIPAIPYDDVLYVDAYHACDALVALAQEDCAKKTVLEAWSAGKAVIAFDGGSSASLVQDGKNGLLIEPGAHDPSASLAAPLVLLSAFEGLRRQLGEQGRKEALAHHDWSRISAQQEEIYLLAEKHHQASLQQLRKKKAA